MITGVMDGRATFVAPHTVYGEIPLRESKNSPRSNLPTKNALERVPSGSNAYVATDTRNYCLIVADGPDMVAWEDHEIPHL